MNSDLIATGGSASAAGELIEKCGGKTLEYLFIVGLPFLKVCLGNDPVSQQVLNPPISLRVTKSSMHRLIR